MALREYAIIYPTHRYSVYKRNMIKLLAVIPCAHHVSKISMEIDIAGLQISTDIASTEESERESLQNTSREHIGIRNVNKSS